MREGKFVATVTVDLAVTIGVDVTVPFVGDDGEPYIQEEGHNSFVLTDAGYDYAFGVAEDVALTRADSIEGYDGMGVASSLMLDDFDELSK